MTMPMASIRRIPVSALCALILLLGGGGVAFSAGTEDRAPVPCIGDVDREQDLYVLPGEPLEHARARIEYEALSGRIEAVRVLALFYLDGIGGERDEKKGLELLRDAAVHGSAWAQMDLGVQLQINASDRGSLEEARFWYTTAAENPASPGYLRSAACIAVGGLYEYLPREDGTHLDNALAWYEKGGGPDALFHMGLLYARNPSLDGAGEKAEALFLEAAASGSRQAFRQLAAAALVRNAGEQGETEAFTWLTLALATAWSDEKPPLQGELSRLRERMSPDAVQRAEARAAGWKKTHPHVFME